MRKILFIALLTLAGLLSNTGRLRAQQLALETDVLMLGALAPNLSLEMITGERTSFSLSAAGCWKPYTLDMKGVGLRPELKIWLSGRPLTREYLGIMGFCALYDMTFSSKVRQGTAAGLGLTGGYSFWLSDYFSIELSAGAGVMYYSQRLYAEGTDYEAFFASGEKVRDNSYGYSLVPMKLSATLIWILK